MKIYFKLTIFALAITIFFSLTLFASTLSTLKGHIKNKETGKAISKVKVTIISTRSKTEKYELYTDKKGYYYKTALRNGIYKIFFEKEGYVPKGTSVKLGVSDTKKVDMDLKSIKIEPQNLTAKLAQKGIKMIDSGKYQEAIKILSGLIKENQKNPYLFYNRGIAYEKMGDMESAISDFKKSLEFKPDVALSLSTLVTLGKLYAKQQNFSEAILYYKKAIDLGSEDTYTLYNYGVCLINLGKNDTAQTVLEKLLSIDPEYADAYYQMGILYLGLEDFNKTKEYLGKFIELDPENSKVPVAKEILKSLN